MLDQENMVIYIMGYYSVISKAVQFAAPWSDLQSIMLSEVRGRITDA